MKKFALRKRWKVHYDYGYSLGKKRTWSLKTFFFCVKKLRSVFLRKSRVQTKQRKIWQSEKQFVWIQICRGKLVLVKSLNPRFEEVRHWRWILIHWDFLMGYGEREGIEGECEVSRKLSLDSCISTKNESTKKKKKSRIHSWYKMEKEKRLC